MSEEINVVTHSLDHPFVCCALLFANMGYNAARRLVLHDNHLDFNLPPSMLHRMTCNPWKRSGLLLVRALSCALPPFPLAFTHTGHHERCGKCVTLCSSTSVSVGSPRFPCHSHRGVLVTSSTDLLKLILDLVCLSIVCFPWLRILRLSTHWVHGSYATSILNRHGRAKPNSFVGGTQRPSMQLPHSSRNALISPVALFRMKLPVSSKTTVWPASQIRFTLASGGDTSAA